MTPLLLATVLVQGMFSSDVTSSRTSKRGATADELSSPRAAVPCWSSLSPLFPKAFRCYHLWLLLCQHTRRRRRLLYRQRPMTEFSLMTPFLLPHIDAGVVLPTLPPLPPPMTPPVTTSLTTHGRQSHRGSPRPMMRHRSAVGVSTSTLAVGARAWGPRLLYHHAASPSPGWRGPWLDSSSSCGGCNGVFDVAVTSPVGRRVLLLALLPELPGRRAS